MFTTPLLSDTLVFDSVSVYRTGFVATVNGRTLKEEEYYLDPITARFYVKDKSLSGELKLSYQRTPINFNQPLYHKSPDLIVSDTVTQLNPFIYSVSSANPNDDLFGSSQLNKQGSISRGGHDW